MSFSNLGDVRKEKELFKTPYVVPESRWELLRQAKIKAGLLPPEFSAAKLIGSTIVPIVLVLGIVTAGYFFFIRRK